MGVDLSARRATSMDDFQNSGSQGTWILLGWGACGAVAGDRAAARRIRTLSKVARGPGATPTATAEASKTVKAPAIHHRRAFASCGVTVDMAAEFSGGVLPRMIA